MNKIHLERYFGVLGLSKAIDLLTFVFHETAGELVEWLVNCHAGNLYAAWSPVDWPRSLPLGARFQMFPPLPLNLFLLLPQVHSGLGSKHFSSHCMPRNASLTRTAQSDAEQQVKGGGQGVRGDGQQEIWSR